AAFGSRRRDFGEDGAQAVGKSKQAAENFVIGTKAAVAHQAENVFAGVRQLFDFVEREASAGSLEGMNHAENAVEQIGVGFIFFENEKVLLELVEGLGALDDEIANELLLFIAIHVGVSAASFPENFFDHRDQLGGLERLDDPSGGSGLLARGFGAGF